ncbi:MAG: methyltransferase domain-containing protein [Nitrospirae bacterium]|nr:methyltransferase domain-containing protein [Nitrospirota bacterium]
MEGLRAAQERYAEYLVSKVPTGVKHILDVGCGTGGMALKLKTKGYAVTGVSPDPYQQVEFSKRSGCPFFLSKFEALRERPKADLILMAESVQYFPVQAGFAQSREILPPRGWILAADYFCKFKDGSRLTKSGHLESEYRAAGKESGFEIEFEEDLTERAVPTLELGFGWVNQYAMPAYELMVEALRKRYPRLTRLAMVYFRKKLDQLREQLVVIDPDAFRRAKTYRVILWRRVV